MQQIETLRNTYHPVALRVSRLFFVLSELMSVNDMYQYSLNFFKNIFINSLKSADSDKNDRGARKAYFIKDFMFRLYKNVCRSLFEKDKLLFSFLICLCVMYEEEGRLDEKEVRFLLAGASSVEMEIPNPTGEGGWLLDKAWASILEMSRDFEVFKGFDTEFSANIKTWETLYNSQDPIKDINNWPGQWNELNLIRKCIVMRILRPDKVI